MRSIEIFSGAGGMALGISKAGFKTALLVDKDKTSITTLKKNKKLLNAKRETKIIHDDVSAIEYADMKGKISLLAGGPPCQPFSIGGKRKGSDDVRDMFPELARIIHCVQPEAFLIENVRGLKGEKFKNYLEYLRLLLTFPFLTQTTQKDWRLHLREMQNYQNSHSLESTEYKVNIQSVNAADYGVPQNRERIFIVGVRKDINMHWSFPEPTHSLEALLIDKFINKSYWERNEVSLKSRESATPTITRKLLKISEEKIHTRRPWVTVREGISGLPDPRKKYSLEEYKDHEFRDGARIYPGHTGSYIDLPAKTIKAGVNGVPGGENMIRFEDGNVRYFTSRELARIQSFPDTYQFEGSWTQKTRQIGNAVPPTLAYVISKSIKDSLELYKNKHGSKA